MVFCGWMIQFNVWMYWEVTPRTFKSKLHPGVPIRQFRVVIQLSTALVWEKTGWVWLSWWRCWHTSRLRPWQLQEGGELRGRASRQSSGMQKLSDDTQALTES